MAQLIPYWAINGPKALPMGRPRSGGNVQMKAELQTKFVYKNKASCYLFQYSVKLKYCAPCSTMFRCHDIKFSLWLWIWWPMPVKKIYSSRFPFFSRDSGEKNEVTWEVICLLSGEMKWGKNKKKSRISFYYIIHAWWWKMRRIVLSCPGDKNKKNWIRWLKD